MSAESSSAVTSKGSRQPGDLPSRLESHFPERPPTDLDVAGRRRWLALIALALSGVVIGLDVTVLNLALPTLAVDLHGSSGDLQWFIDAYTLVFAAVILPAGLLGDRYGRERLLLVGLVLFGLASGPVPPRGLRAR